MDTIVSVIMPVYNAEKYIKRAIESILNQTFQDFELLIIDDGSQDNSIEIANSFKTNKIRLFYTGKQSGAAAARNLGIAQAKGKYIAFLDADDEAYPERLATQVAFLDANLAIDLLASWIKVFDNQGNKLPYIQTVVPFHHLPIKLLFQNCFALSSVMLRKKGLTHLEFDNAFAPAEDYALWARLSYTCQMAILPIILVKYLSHSEGISQKKPEIMTKMVFQIIHSLLGKLKINPTAQEYALHQQIGHLTFEPSVLFFVEVDKWLHKLRKANLSAQIYPILYFDELLLHHWKYICQAHFQQKKNLASLRFWRTFAFSFYTRLWLKEKIKR